jgi:hypothetical protein
MSSDLAGLDLRGSWQPLTTDAAHDLPGCLGVYQLAERDGTVLRIGYAGGRSLFGLRGELAAAAAEPRDRPVMFRVEQNMQYLTRWRELLMIHRARHGELPSQNSPDDADGLGYLGTRPKEEEK